MKRNNPSQAVATALKSGALRREPCAGCGASKVQAHHPDYSLPLHVVWLCRKCHAAEHAVLRKMSGRKALPRRGDAGNELVQLYMSRELLAAIDAHKPANRSQFMLRIIERATDAALYGIEP